MDRKPSPPTKNALNLSRSQSQAIRILAKTTPIPIGPRKSAVHPTTNPDPPIPPEPLRGNDHPMDPTGESEDIHVPPGYEAGFAYESNPRREGKLWCFTLNNPCPEDMFTSEYAINPDFYTYLIAAREKGKNGTPHLQGFIRFKEKKRLSWITHNVFVSTKTGKGRASWFLCGGTAEQNIVYCKKGEQSKEEWLKFKEKGPNYGLNADFIEIGDVPSEGRGKGKKNQNQVYAEAFALPSADEALKHLAENAPRDYALQRHNLEKNIYQHYLPKEVYKPKYSLADFNHPGVLFGSSLATLVWGPSNLGKTAFVKAHFLNPLFCTHIDALKSFKKYEHDAIIFDDMSFMHMPPETVIHILETDSPASIHCRHRTAEIPAGVVKVFTSNLQNPFYDPNKVPEAQQEAINRRFKRLHVTTPLFTKK